MGFNQQEHDMGLPENWGIHFKWQMFIGKMMMNGILGHYIFRETMTNLLLYILYIYIIFGKGHFTQVKNEWKRHWIDVLHGVAKLQLRSCLFRMCIFQQPK